MSKYIKAYICILGILIFISSCKNDKPSSISKADITNSFQHILDSIYNVNKDAIGLMVHIEAPDQQISWSGAVGVSNKETNAPIAADQPAVIASNTKTYVAATILNMVEDHALKLDDSLSKYLTEATNQLLIGNNYQTDAITIKHLLSHTSGILDYAGTDAYMELVKKDMQHRWTRDEQIALAMSMGKPLGNPGDVFAYADTNYLLLTEIIEQITKTPFYTVIRNRLDFKKHDLNDTWFLTLENSSASLKPLVHQYVSSMGLHNYEVDQSFDLYGGGGLAATTKDLARFSQSLFNNKLFKNPESLELMLTKANPKEPMQGDYYFGVSSIDINGVKGYGHGGFWGTAVNYFPDLNASIAIFVLERDQRILRLHLNQALVKALNGLK